MTVISPADPIEMALATRAILEFDGPVYMRTGRSPCSPPVRRRSQIRDRQGPDPARRRRRHHRRLRRGSGARAGRRRACWRKTAFRRASSICRPSSPSIPICWPGARVETGAVVTAEDHNIHGGLGGAVAESLAATTPCPIEFVGVKDTFGASGEPEELAASFRHHRRRSSPTRQGARWRARRNEPLFPPRQNAPSSPAAAAASAAPSPSAWRKPARTCSSPIAKRPRRPTPSSARSRPWAAAPGPCRWT